MSFILDALKKSEMDRQRQTSPALFEVKVAQRRRKFPLWAIGLAVLFVVNVAALAWLLLRAADAPPPAASAGAGNSLAAATAGAPPGMVTVPATVTIPTTVNIPVGSAPTIVVGTGATGMHDVQAGAIAPSSAPPLVEEPVLSGHEQSVPPDYNASDYAEAVTPAQARATTEARSASGAPSRDELIARGTQLPELRLDMHVYAANPAERFVFINMRKLREGDSLPEGVRVEFITPTGARLSFRGTRFTIDGN